MTKGVLDPRLSSNPVQLPFIDEHPRELNANTVDFRNHPFFDDIADAVNHHQPTLGGGNRIIHQARVFCPIWKSA
ncbi:hypothetical protein D3C87_1829620 [compost metagenome]